MYQDDNNIYHYSGGESLPRDEYSPMPREEKRPEAPSYESAPVYSYDPEMDKKKNKKKSGGGVKVVALVLLCAVVSGLCGFADYAGFYRAFVGEYGVAPREYADSVK